MALLELYERLYQIGRKRGYVIKTSSGNVAHGICYHIHTPDFTVEEADLLEKDLNLRKPAGLGLVHWWKRGLKEPRQAFLKAIIDELRGKKEL